MGYELNNLMKMYGVGTASKAAYTGAAMPGTPPADTASAADKAAFDESVRKYQLDRKAYEQYASEYGNRIAGTNLYDQPQYSTTQERFKPKTPGHPTVMGQPDAVTPVARETLRAPSYGAISQFSNLTPEQQGNLYKQQRDIGYTDADIRKATSAQIGTPSESSWTNYMKTAYPEYGKAVEEKYGTLFNRTGFGGEANQIDNPGYNYWMNQLSTGAATPSTLEEMMRAGAGTTSTTTPGTTTPGGTTPSSDINALYRQYFNRDADPAGLQYWQQSGLTGDALKNAIVSGAKGNDLYYYNTKIAGIPMNNPNADHSGGTPSMNAARGGYINRYANGGQVRTHYQKGGGAQVGDLSGLEDYYNQEPYTGNPSYPMSSRLFGGTLKEPVLGPINTSAMDLRPNIGEQGTSQPIIESPLQQLTANIGEGGTPQPLEATISETMPASMPAAAAAPGGLEAMLQRYGRQGSEYSAELRSARARANAESQAFSRMLQGMMNSPEDERASKAEMYFRLASAFGSPTKTGHFGETLSTVGREMSEYSKGQRASASERRKLALEGQKLQMEGAKADLNTLRAMAQEEMRDQRALQTALIQEYIRSGQPQSNAGKLLKDLGIKPGMPEYQTKLEEFANLDISKQIQKMNVESERLRLSQAALALREDERRKLSPKEFELKRETEDSLSGARQSLTDLQEAYRLNANSYTGSLLDRGKRVLYENAGSDAPIVVNTRRLENLLGEQGLEKLKSTFGSQITDSEREVLLKLQGIGAKSIEERNQILHRAYLVLQDRIRRQERRLEDINSGKYGEKSSAPSGGQP